MNEQYEMQVNLPEVTMESLEADSPIYHTEPANSENDLESLEAAFESGILDSLKKLSKKTKNVKKPSKNTAKKQNVKKTMSKSTKINSKPAGSSKTNTYNLSKTTKKPMTKKQVELNRLLKICTSSEAIQVFNPETNKNDVSIVTKDGLEVVYSYKGAPGWAYNLLNQTPKSRGAKLAHVGITSMKVTTKDGQTYTLTKGESKVKSLKKSKSKGVKTEKGTVKSVPVICNGLNNLKGESKKGLLTGETKGTYEVTFKSKSLGTSYMLQFSKKSLVQIDHPPLRGWVIDSERLKSA